MSFAITLSDVQWSSPPTCLTRPVGGAPAVIPRRQMFDAMLFTGRTEGSEASARAWLEVASVGYLAWRAAA